MRIKSIGVIGLGSMGLSMCQSLLRAGFVVHYTDVARERCEATIHEFFI